MEESADNPVPAVERSPAVAIETLGRLGGWRANSAVSGYADSLPAIWTEIGTFIRCGLPHVLRLVADEASLDDALQLARAHGGTRIYVPAKPTPHFIQEVGSGAARVLSQHYANELIDIPLGPLSIQWMSTVAIRALLVHGQYSIAAIARLCLVSERSVYKHKAFLVRMGVLERRDASHAVRPASHALVSLMLAEDTPPPLVAQQLDVPLAEVERQAGLMQRRAPQERGR